MSAARSYVRKYDSSETMTAADTNPPSLQPTDQRIISRGVFDCQRISTSHILLISNPNTAN